MPCFRALAAVLLGTLAYALPAVAQEVAPREVIVNEIDYAPPSSDLEFVELYNRSDQTIDLSRFAFSDSRQDTVAVTTASPPLAPGEYAVLARDSAAFAAQFPGVAVTEPPRWPALNNTGDAVVLYVGGQTTVDSVHYAPSWGGNDDTSLERINPAGASDSPSNFDSSVDPDGATPGRQNSLFEIDETPPVLTAAVPTENGDTLRASFSEPLDLQSVAPADFTVRGPSGAQTPASAIVHGRRVVLTLDPPLEPGDYALVAQEVADASGNTLDHDKAVFTYFRGAAPTAHEVVINEIFYDPPDEEQEFIELYNRSDKTFDLSQFTFSDNQQDTTVLTPERTPLTPKSYAVLARDSAAFAQKFPGVTVIEPPDWPALNNSVDASVLYVQDTSIDSVAYDQSWGGHGGTSLERRDPAGPSVHPANFGSSTAPDGATPGAQNSLFAPDETAPQPTFAEQTGDTTVQATFSEPLDTAALNRSRFSLGGTSPIALAFPSRQTQVRLHFDAPVEGTTLTVTGLRDLTGNVLDEASISVAQRAAPGDVVINELLYAPLADEDDDRPDQPEYVELHNRTSHLLSLRGFHFTDAPNEDGEADTLRLQAGAVGLAPEGFAVVFAHPTTGNAPATESELAEAFPSVDFTAPRITLLPLDRHALGLGNSGDLVALHRASGTLLDSVRYAPDWHHPSLADKRGVALGRVDPAGAANQATNWSSSTADAGGTPGRPNSVFLAPDEPLSEPGLRVTPSPFSPDGDGRDDQTAIRYSLKSLVSSIRVRIYDQSGRLVRTLTQASLAGRTGQLTWNGRDDDGRRLRLGIYVVLLEAVDPGNGHTEAYKAPVVLARPLD